MRFRFLLLFSLGVVLLAIPGDARGQCAACGQSAGYQWLQSTTDPDCWGLTLNGFQVGGWRQSNNCFRPLYGNLWGAPSSPPVAPPAVAVVKASGCNCCDSCPCDGDTCPCKLGKEPCSRDCKCLLSQSQAVVTNYGIAPDPERKSDGPRYVLNGKHVSKRQAIEAITAQLPDDRAKLSLTFCGGTEGERQAALASATALGLDSACLVHAYAADNPLLKAGFVTTGRPTVYLQAPDGRVLIRADSAAEDVMQAVRAKVASYDPAKDPTAGGGGLTLAEIEKKLQEVPSWVWIIGAVALFVFARKENKI